MKLKIFLFFFTFFILSSRLILANQNNGFSISPPFSNIKINKDDLSKTFDIEVTNNTDSIISARLSAIDFSNNKDYTGVVFHGLNSDDYEKKYSLASWISLEKDLVVLEPKTSQKIKITINNRESLRPGGHYGAVLVSLEGESQKGISISLKQSYASLIFVNKTDGEVVNFALEKYTYKKNLFYINKQIEIDFKNTGNVHLVPRGTVKIYDAFNRNIAKGLINTESQIIFPETYRTYKINMSSMKKILFPGIYRVEIDYRYDGFDSFQNTSFKFFYIGFFWLIFLIIFLPIFVAKKLRKN